MRRRRWFLLAAPLALLALWAAVTGSRWLGGDAPVRDEPALRARSAGGQALARSLALGRLRAAKLPFVPSSEPATGSVTIAGTVIDARTAQPVGDVEVVFRSHAGEETTVANPDGTYQIEVPAGSYRAFVRDDAVLSVGRSDRIRLPAAPTAETANAPDEALMPLVLASADARGIDLSVVRAGTLRGRVIDRDGKPVAKAVLRASERADGLRPTLGTDVAETADDGRFEMRLPEGTFGVVANHPRFAGISDHVAVHVPAGQVVDRDLTLVAGCVITGKVVTAAGKPAGDGALEKQWGSGHLQYGPSGRIEPDGTFRWTSLDEGSVVLRAWPWKSPPSPERRFDCVDGARFTDVVFQLPDTRPDIEGVLVDASGAPVPFAHVDLSPLTPGGIGQQERTDAEGKWAVYQMPAGRYLVNATAQGRGVVALEIDSPQTNVRLQLSGTGRIDGVTSQLANGSIEIAMAACMSNGQSIQIPQDRRLVAVVGGRFTIEDAPACQLELAATWRDQIVTSDLDVPAGGTAKLELALGPPRPKRITGLVRDARGEPLAGARITATHGKSIVSARSDSTGRYTLDTFSGATVMAYDDAGSGEAVVGMANVDSEQVDVQIVELDTEG